MIGLEEVVAMRHLVGAKLIAFGAVCKSRKNINVSIQQKQTMPSITSRDCSIRRQGGWHLNETRSVGHVADVAHHAHRGQHLVADHWHRTICAHGGGGVHVREQIAVVASLVEGIVGKGCHLRDGSVVIIGERIILVRHAGVGKLGLLRRGVDVVLVVRGIQIDNILVCAHRERLVGGSDIEGSHLGVEGKQAFRIVTRSRNEMLVSNNNYDYIL